MSAAETEVPALRDPDDGPDMTQPMAGEEILWRGRPNPRDLIVNGFHVGWMAAYFLVLALWSLGSGVMDGGDAGALIRAGLLPLAGGALVCGAVALYAFLIARGTRYLVTSKRIVLSFGVALPIAISLPHPMIVSADLKRRAGGRGDIALAIDAGRGAGTAAPGRRGPSRVLLWPYLRMDRWLRAVPLMRAVDDADGVARLIARTLAASSGMAAPVTADMAVSAGATPGPGLAGARPSVA